VAINGVFTFLLKMEAKMPFGYAGKILHVDLNKGALSIETPSENFYRTYMGGSAMGLYYLLKEVPPCADPLSPQNVLTLMVGVTTGAPISGQSRMNANAKSPMSGAIGDSQSGGFFPAEMKFAGLDGIVVHGKSPKLVYLYIKDGEATLRDASHLMGKLTGDVENTLKTDLGDTKIQILQCGPAAEVGVRYSSLVSMSNRNNGRTGMGLVMASKNLKAIVVRGSHPVQLADPNAFKTLARSGPSQISENPDMDGLAKFGTASVVMFQNMSGTLPTRNYSEGQFEEAENLSGEKMSESILKKADTCFACAVHCKRVVEVPDGKYSVDPVYGGPEYETIATFGSYCGIQDLVTVSRANQICNAYGVDTISCGATIAFAMECFEKGIITTADTDGLELRFGNADAMLEILHQIVTASTPLGKILGQGSERAAHLWGSAAQACLITVKGEEAPAHMPQAKKSLALIYAVNPFGADHQSSEHDWMYEEECAPLYLERLKHLGLTNPPPAGSFNTEKVRFAALTQVFYSLLDTLDLCQFVWGPAWTLFGPVETVELVRTVTGWDVTLDELMQVGQRRLNLLRWFNAREGFSRSQDLLPIKFFTPLGGTGPTASVTVNEQEFQSALNQYYELNGWTSDGIPTRDTLQRLKIDWVIPDSQ
jgi:aldehyde:ferredoxin oxidoreductase